MNILFLTPRESKTNLGGVERHVRLLAEELERRGHQVKELSLEETDKSYKDYKNYKGRKINKFLAWKLLWDSRELLRWAEVIHVHDVFWWVMPFLPMIWWDKFYKNYKGYKNSGGLYVTFHGWEGKCPPTKSGVWQKRLAAFLSEGTIGVGSFFKKWYGVRTDRVVWGVLDPRIAERGVYKGPTLPRQGRTLGTGNKIVFFGRLEEVNGIEMVIEAIKLMRALKVRPWRTPRSDLSIVFVGDGSYRKPAESVGKVTGMVREPWKYLAEAEVVIASSYLAILEAAALGKRIIAIENNPLKRDYLEGYPLRGYFKVVGSAEELIEAMADKDYKSYKDYKEKGEGNTWALGQTAEKLADEYEKLWRGGGDG